MAGSPASRAAVGLSPLCVTLCDSRQCDETPGPGWKEAGLQSGAGVMSPDGPHTRVLDRTARIVSDNTDSGFYLGPPESWFLGSGPGNPVFWNNGGQCEKECWSGNKDPGPAIMEALLSRGVDDEGSGDKEGILCTFTSSPLHPVNLFPKGQGCVKFSSSKQGRKAAACLFVPLSKIPQVRVSGEPGAPKGQQMAKLWREGPAGRGSSRIEYGAGPACPLGDREAPGGP